MNANNKITDGITSGIELRKQRGLEIAALVRIDKEGDTFIVPSQFNPRQTKYRVNYGENPTCTCPDFETRGCRCKHIYAVGYSLKREQNADGSTTVTETVSISKTQKTYSQNWPAYNEAQTMEKRDFQTMLYDLCADVADPFPAQGKPRRGRPRLPFSDALFSAIFKVYSTVSARRFTSDLCDAQAKGYIEKVPHFNSVLGALEMPGLFPILTSMIERSALPLRAVETCFAADSTGFAVCRFDRWFDIKYNKYAVKQHWVKAHMMTGVKTNVVTAIEILERDASDDAQMPALVTTTAKGFTMKEVSADKGYSSRGSHDAIAATGATPYIAFKANTTGKVGGLFEKMFHYFSFNREDFLNHYHQRSNVESTVMMIKTKFRDNVRSKSDVAQKNEVLAKVLCHNICCLISAVYELGIQPVFQAAQKTACLHKNFPVLGH